MPDVAGPMSAIDRLQRHPISVELPDARKPDASLNF
jgi:hypothetical protein